MAHLGHETLHEAPHLGAEPVPTRWELLAGQTLALQGSSQRGGQHGMAEQQLPP